MELSVALSCKCYRHSIMYLIHLNRSSSIISSFLSYRLLKTKSMFTDHYGKKLVETFFYSKTEVDFDVNYLHEWYAFKLLFTHKIYPWIKLDKLFSLFPNIKKLEIELPDISVQILDDILQFLDSHSLICNTLKCLKIYRKNINDISWNLKQWILHLLNNYDNDTSYTSISIKNAKQLIIDLKKEMKISRSL